MSELINKYDKAEVITRKTDDKPRITLKGDKKGPQYKDKKNA